MCLLRLGVGSPLHFHVDTPYSVVFEAPDRTSKDIKSTNETIGCIPVKLDGDFRQILPMIRSGTRTNIYNQHMHRNHIFGKK